MLLFRFFSPNKFLHFSRVLLNTSLFCTLKFRFFLLFLQGKKRSLNKKHTHKLRHARRHKSSRSGRSASKQDAVWSIPETVFRVSTQRFVLRRGWSHVEVPNGWAHLTHRWATEPTFGVTEGKPQQQVRQWVGRLPNAILALDPTDAILAQRRPFYAQNPRCFSAGVGIRLVACDILEQIAQATSDHLEPVWTDLPTHQQGIKVLGTLLEHADFQRAHLDRKVEEHQELLRRIPTVLDLQSAWFVQLHCAAAKATPVARASTLFCCTVLCRLLDISPFQHHGHTDLGQSASCFGVDCLQMIQERQPKRKSCGVLKKVWTHLRCTLQPVVPWSSPV